MSAEADRKLATIVAVDVAGYSSRSEDDEAQAVLDVGRVKARIERSAAAHGGRVFNTAGDGFMMEFPTVSGALAAAEEVARNLAPPVRVGVHLGEVTVTPDGDLLGHGVNVAARLQALAAPGGVVVSGDVKRAVRGPLHDRLRSQGELQLDKMREVLPVFTLAGIGGLRSDGPPPRRKRRRVVAAAIFGTTLAALAGAWLLWANRAGDTPGDRIAVLPLETLSSGQAIRDFAAVLADQVLSVMSANQISTVSRTDTDLLKGPGRDRQIRALGVRALMSGTVQSDGAALRVSVHLDDPRRHATLWSANFDGEATQASKLQQQVAVKVSAVLMCADQWRRTRAAPRDPESQVLFLRACDRFAGLMESDEQEAEQTLEALRQLTARAPDFAWGHAKLASTIGVMLRYGGVERGQELRAEGEAEARKAAALDDKEPEVYLAQSLLSPVQAFAERDAFLQRSAALHPAGPDLVFRTSQLLAEVGRMTEASDYASRAAARAPLDPSAAAQAALYLAAAGGRAREADAAIAQASRTWPLSAPVWGENLYIAIWAGRLDDAVQSLGRAPTIVPPDQLQNWGDCLRALKSSDQALRLREGQKQAAFAQGGQMNLRTSLQCLSLLGLVDQAFEVSKGYDGKIYLFEGSSMFFLPSTAAMRRDPRFIPLAGRIGLVDYWRKTGKWPDYCADRALTYDCKAEAAKWAAPSKV